MEVGRNDNQEDSLIFNKSSVERGLFRAMYLKKYLISVQKNQSTSQDDIFMKPDPTKVANMKNGSYDKLNDKGYVPEETKIENGDVIFGKVTPIPEAGPDSKPYRDTSESFKMHASGVVDRVYVDIQNQDGYLTREALIRSERIPRIGDKYCFPETELVEVLTDHGWIDIKQITFAHKVATLVEECCIEYERPAGIYNFDYDGKIYKLRSPNADFDVTVDHELYATKLFEVGPNDDPEKIRKKNCDIYCDYEYSKIRAGDLYKKSYIMKRDCLNMNKNLEHFNAEDFFDDYVKTGVLDIATVVQLSKEQIRDILSYIMRGKLVDMNNYATDFETRNFNIYKDIQTLLIHSDLEYDTCEISEDEYEEEKYDPDLWKVVREEDLTSENMITFDRLKRWNNFDKEIKGNIYKIYVNSCDDISIHVDKDDTHELYDYKGKVYCLQVPSSIMMIRQNGKHLWIGNCCYDDRTEVLTYDGWKLFKDLKYSDYVATLQNGNTLEYKKPIAIQKYAHDGQMYKVLSKQIDLVVTTNHRMYVKRRHGKKYEILEASDIYGKHVNYKKDAEIYKTPIVDIERYMGYVIKNNLTFEDFKNNVGRQYNPIKGDKFVIPAHNNKLEREFDLKQMLIIFGIWIAEGSAYESEKPINANDGEIYEDEDDDDEEIKKIRSQYQCYINFSAHKTRVKNKLIEIFKSLNINFYNGKEHKNDKKNACIRIYDRQIAKYFVQYRNKSPNRFLPMWVWTLGKEFLKYLLYGLILGDGYQQKDKKDKKSKKSKKNKKYDDSDSEDDEEDNADKNITDITSLKDGETFQLIRYDTSSEKLRDDIQRLCLQCGYSANYSRKAKAGDKKTPKTGRYAGKEIILRFDHYRLSIITGQNEPRVNKQISQSRNDSLVNYKGFVYCCTINDKNIDGGIIYVRRKVSYDEDPQHVVRPCWSGNSRHGQKGTIGILLNGADMPFNKYGVRPDIILNPNAIPSRMTIGQLLECLIGKTAALQGMDADGTSFEEFDIEMIKDTLESLGYERNGHEYLYNGMTGEKMKVAIFMGPTYYQRLKHLVEDKLHSRARGPKTSLTRRIACLSYVEKHS